MRKILSASVLTLALYVPVLAGDIPNPLGPQPAAGTELAGDIPNPLVTQPEADGATQFGLTATWLSVIESVFALF